MLVCRNIWHEKRGIFLSIPASDGLSEAGMDGLSVEKPTLSLWTCYYL